MKAEFPSWLSTLLKYLAIPGVLASAWVGWIKFADMVESKVDARFTEVAMPLIDSAIAKAKLNQKNGFRGGIAVETGIPKEEVQSRVSAVVLGYPRLDSLYKVDKAAIMEYFALLSYFLYNELEDFEYKGQKMKMDENTGIHYWLYHGLIFECFKKGRPDAWFIKTSYGEEIEVEGRE